jgi:hypothetical protein
MSQRAIFLHFGHIASTDAAFFLATLVYVPVGAIALVAAMEVGARNGVGLARRFMAQYDGAGRLAKAAAFLLVLSSSFDLGYLPSHFKLVPVAAALFSLDAAVLMGSSLLVVTLPALRPAALILMVAGIVAYMVGGVQLDATALAAKGIEVLALVLLLAAIVRTGGQAEQEEPTSTSVVAVDGPPPARDNVGRQVRRRARGGRRQSRRRAASRSGC